MASLNPQVASPSSSSSSTTRWTYQVFLSFYGKDTRNSFTDHLHTALLQKGINVFRDDEKLKRGENISQELLKAIEESQYAVVIISENYALSKWCLAELTKIMKCRTQTQMIVLPIFYHVNPSDVRNQKRTFEEAFAQHMKAPKVDKDQMEAWRSALKEVGSLAGWHVYNRSEARVVEEISAKILRELKRNFSNISKHLVGLKSRIEELKTLLCMGCDDVRCVGIYGMSGIGKTTLAKLIYDTTSSEFEASCFLAEDKQVWNQYDGVQVIAKSFISRKALIIIDDVDGKKHLEALKMLEEALAEDNHNWFAPGSRIILISKDRHLISQYVDCEFEVKELNDSEALELFSWKAFKKPFPKEDYLELSRDIIEYAKGLPLAIEVFGSSLFGKSLDTWRSGRKMLEANPNVEILDKLKISFNGLEDIQKQLFLDIACFFDGQSLEYLIPILESFGRFPKFNIGVLRDKSLIKIRNKYIWMHDLLKKMGQKIVYDESPKEVEKRSRLWHYEEIIPILKNNSTANAIAIEGIRLLLPHGNQEELNLDTFSKMNMLRMIEIIPKYSYSEDYSLEVIPKKWQWLKGFFKFILKESHRLKSLPESLKWIGDPSKFVLSNKLCLINWFQYPLQSLPTTYQSKNLVELILPCSYLKILWRGSKNFEKLRVIHLNYSINLIETPDLTKVPNLEKLELSYCTSLSKVHPSIGSLKWLKLLDLSGCKSLKNLPENLEGMESLEELNINQTSLGQFLSSICSLKKLKVLKGWGAFSNPISFHLVKSFSSFSSLESLDLGYCNLSDGMIPNDLSNLSSLERLCLDGNKFNRVPEFVNQLSKLKVLGLSYCNLMDGGITDDISCLSLLKELHLKGNRFTTISDSISQLPNLGFLDLSDNIKLQALPKLQTLPKLPCAILGGLWRSNCPLLNTSSMDKWGPSVQTWKSTFGVTYYGYDGKSYRILYTDSKYASTSHLEGKWVDVDVACGPTLGSEIPEWFVMRSSGSFEIQGCMTGSKILDFKGIALFIVYEVCESLDYGGSDDSNPAILEIASHTQSQRTGIEIRIVEVPPSWQIGFERRRNGVWVFLSHKAIEKSLHTCGYSPDHNVNLEESVDITFSVTTNSPNIEVKEYGARGVNSTDVEDWCQLLSDISFRGWAPLRFEDFYSHSFRTCFYSHLFQTCHYY